MQPIEKSWLDFCPGVFHNRLIRDDSGNYWLSCQRRSELRRGNHAYFPMNPILVMEAFTISNDGTVIFED
jgi:hypothetical protein